MIPRRRGSGLAAVLAAAALLGRPAAAETPSPERPRELGLAERAEARLAQIDISVSGPPDVVAALAPEDFTIQVEGTRVRAFALDRLCGPASGGGGAAHERVGPRPTFLFYFDQPQLTLAGRQRALDVARELVGRLADGRAQAMVVSNARELALVEPVTADRDALLAALERLEHDRRQWDEYAELEERRVADVVHELNTVENLGRAIALARRYQREEQVRSDRDLRRLAVALGQLAELEPPKSLIYFADTTRSNPGEHYLAFFGRALRAQDPLLAAMATDGTLTEMAFDRVVNEAAAQGVRIYAVEARGLMLPTEIEPASPLGISAGGAVPASSRVRVSDTHRTFQSLAGETGGEAFLHGVGASRIAERILSESACVFLASFDPTGFAEDEPLRVRVEVSRPGVTLHTRGRLVLPSASTRLTARLLRAFATPGSIPDPFEVRAGLVPTGFRDGRYVALLQVAVPGSLLQGATWDLGASLVSGERVRSRAAGRIAPSGPGIPVILEHEVEVAPGAWEIVAVAHEVRSRLVASRVTRLAWPRLSAGEPGVGPIALLQPGSGAFLRGGAVRGGGALVVSAGEPVGAARPAAFVTVVCRGKARGPAVAAERALHGPTVHEFPAQELAQGEGCVQLRDVVPSNTLRDGYYRYEVRVLVGDEVAARGERDLLVVEPPAEPAP